jgi:hypothetical protein
MDRNEFNELNERIFRLQHLLWSTKIEESDLSSFDFSRSMTPLTDRSAIELIVADVRYAKEHRAEIEAELAELEKVLLELK